MNEQIVKTLDKLNNYGIRVLKNSETELSSENITNEIHLLDGFHTDGYCHLETIFVTKDVHAVKWNGLGRYRFRKFEVDSTNNVFQSINGVLYTKKGYDRLGNYVVKDMMELVACPTTIITHDIAMGTYRIGNCAFKGTNISTLHLPETVKEIGTNSFSFANNLNSIVLPRSVCRIEPQKADSLQSIKYDSHYFNSWEALFSYLRENGFVKKDNVYIKEK